MAHSEPEIRQAIRPLLTVYGELTTSEVKQLLHTVLTFDADDIAKSPSRNNETLIMQRIGNIVAHQSATTKIYNEGFIVDKNTEPAKFSLLNPITGEAITANEVKIIRENRKRFTARKVDWENVRERNDEIGDQGEEFVLEYEIHRLMGKSHIEDPKDSVQHLSRTQGDGLGYDILSINDDGSPRYIEVKTTSNGCNVPFFMSENEKSFFKEYGDAAFIYRVYNFNKRDRRGDVEIISSSRLFSCFKFDATTWMVSPK